MLLTESVELILNGKNIKRYEDLGYKIPRYKSKNGKLSIKKGTTIIVNIEDLSEGSGHVVDIKCDYCGEIIQRKYNEYIARKNGFEKDSCSKCRYKKIKEINSCASSTDNIGYWSQHENIVNEFIKYVNKYKNINNMSEINPSLNYAIQRSNFSKYDLLLDLGYDLKEHIDRRPNGWYDDFNKLSTDIIKISNKYGAFPSYHTVLKELQIGNKVFNKYGGYKGIRQKLDDDNKYIDKSGHYNSSFYEVIVANFLYEIGLQDKYQREVFPFPKEDGAFRCDFYFENNNDKYYCEVWGYDNRELNINKRYNTIRKIKENLYKKYKLNLISIDGWKFDKMKYDNIVHYLSSKFKNITNTSLKTINVKNIIPTRYLTDQELFNIISPLVVDGYLPTVTFLQENGFNIHYLEIIRRYNSYNNFAKAFGVKIQYNARNYWNKNKMFEYLDYMLNNYGKLLKQSEIKNINDEKINKFYNTIRNSKYNGYINIKLDYFLDRANKKLDIPYEDCSWLYSMVKIYGLPENRQITEDNRQTAFSILNILEKNNALDGEFKDYYIKNIYTGDINLDVIIDYFIYMKNKYGEFLSYTQIDKLKGKDKRLSSMCISSRLSHMQISKSEIEKIATQYMNN